MTEFLPVIAVVAAALCGYYVLRLLFRRVRRRRFDTLTAALNAAASARGWTVSSDYRDELWSLHWSGSTDGISWIAVSRWGWRGADDPDSSAPRQRRSVSTTRWETSGLRGSGGPVVLMGMANNPEMPASLPSGDGRVASLVKQALLGAIDKYISEHFAPEFGRAIDATRLQRVDSAERQLPGYIVVAESPADATRVIEKGVGQALSATSGPAPSPDVPEGFFVVICQEGVGLARPEAVKSVGDLEPIIRRGIAIASAVKW